MLCYNVVNGRIRILAEPKNGWEPMGYHRSTLYEQNCYPENNVYSYDFTNLNSIVVNVNDFYSYTIIKTILYSKFTNIAVSSSHAEYMIFNGRSFYTLGEKFINHMKTSNFKVTSIYHRNNIYDSKLFIEFLTAISFSGREEYPIFKEEKNESRNSTNSQHKKISATISRSEIKIRRKLDLPSSRRPIIIKSNPFKH